MVDHPGQGEGGVHREEGIVAVDGHAQLSGDVGHQHADGSQADDTKALAGDLGAYELALALLNHLCHIFASSGLGP